MKATVEEINTVQRRIRIELSSDDVTHAFNNAYAKLQKKASIRGFRPGKAPLNVIKKLYGQSVAADVADDLVRKNLFAAIEDQNLRPVASPVLETAAMPEAGKDFSFTALVDVMPAIKVSGYAGLALGFRPLKVTGDIVDGELKRLQRTHAKSRDLTNETPAVKANVATIAHTATRDGAALEEFNVKGVEVEIGKGDLWHELDDALVGMRVGETKTVIASLPAEYPDADLRNASIHYTLTLETLKELVLPNLDDEFAKDLGLESLDTLKTNISASLAQHAEQDKRRQLEVALLDVLIEKNPFEVPPSLVDQVIDGMIDEMNWQNDKQRDQAKHNPEFRKNLLDPAKRKAKNTLILHEIIKTEKIAVTDDDVNAHVRSMMGPPRADAPEDPQMLDRLRQHLGPQIRENLLFVKAVEHVINAAKVSELA